MNRPARPLPHLPRQTAQLSQAPHLPVPGGAAPPCHRRSLNSTPQRRFTPRRRPPPARVSFIGGAAPRSRLSTPRSRTLAPATPLSSSRSARRHTLLPTGRSLLPAPHPPPDGASSSPEVFFPRSRSVLLRHSSRCRSGYWCRPRPVAGQPLRVPAFNATPLSAPVVVPRDRSVLPSPSILLSLPSDQVIPRWHKVPCCSYG
ncbi:hypothetical protein PVAP13_4KG287305 [Panicum virgatum]|uniref:Uncharacterized protein n=1 Tax=Panicum virgatum TaxID=38727 RepID=A0A8T0TRV6_PANVG|nr:hypothetical protein PVAP13_4KG287305 [Panicum virgatum]